MEEEAVGVEEAALLAEGALGMSAMGAIVGVSVPLVLEKLGLAVDLALPGEQAQVLHAETAVVEAVDATHVGLELGEGGELGFLLADGADVSEEVGEGGEGFLVLEAHLELGPDAAVLVLREEARRSGDGESGHGFGREHEEGGDRRAAYGAVFRLTDGAEADAALAADGMGASAEAVEVALVAADDALQRRGGDGSLRPTPRSTSALLRRFWRRLLGWLRLSGLRRISRLLPIICN